MGINPFLSMSNLETITIHEENKYFKMVDNVLFDINQTRIIYYSMKKESSHYNVPNTVFVIDEYSFAYNKHISSVTIPSSVTTVSHDSFVWCSNLQSAIFEGTKEPKCATNAFNSCPKLSVIYVPSNYEGTTFCGKQVTKQST